MLRTNSKNLDFHAHMNVRDIYIQPTADTIAKHMRMPTKQVISRRYDITKRHIFSDTLCAPAESNQSFRKKSCPEWVQVAETLWGLTVFWQFPLII